MARSTRINDVELGVEDIDVYGDSSSTAANGITHFVRSLFWSAFFFIGLWFWSTVESLSDGVFKSGSAPTSSLSSINRGDYRSSYLTAIRKGYRLTSDRQSTTSQASSKNLNETDNSDVYPAGPSMSNEATGSSASVSTNLERFMMLTENPSREDSGVDSEDDVFTTRSTRRWVSLPPERIRRTKQTRNKSEDRGYLDRSNINIPIPGFGSPRCNCGRDVTVLYVNNICVNHPQSLSISQVQHLVCQTGGIGAAGYTTIGTPCNTYADVHSQEPPAWV